LDEFPATTEFWGRNCWFSFFLWDVWVWAHGCDVLVNAGEVVQLVLRNPNTGAWLPFSFVLRVMIHELAHIKQMVRLASPPPSPFLLSTTDI